MQVTATPEILERIDKVFRRSKYIRIGTMYIMAAPDASVQR